MTINRSKLGKQSKRKGAKYEKGTALFWSKILNSNIKRTPRSGAFWDWPGDIFDMDNSILKDFIIECKFGKTAVPKKIQNKMDEMENENNVFNKMKAPKKITDWMSKLKDESQNKPYFLDMSLPYKKSFIVIPIIYFVNLVAEWEELKNIKGNLPFQYLKLITSEEPHLIVLTRKHFSVILRDLNNFRKLNEDDFSDKSQEYGGCGC